MTNDSPHRISELRALYDKADQFAREVTEFRALLGITVAAAGIVVTLAK